MNKWRSLTAEAILKNHPFYKVKSAGVSESARIRLTEKHINWADQIFVMEKEHKQRMNSLYANALQNKKVIVLDIEDDYQYMDPELVDILTQALEPYLDRF